MSLARVFSRVPAALQPGALRAATLCAALLGAAPCSAVAETVAAPATKDWQVWENRMPGVRIEPGKTTLLIVGQVETAAEAVEPTLRMVGARKDEQDALELELSLTGDAVEAAPAYRPLETLVIVPIYRYKRVYILHKGAPVTERPIEVRPAY